MEFGIIRAPISHISALNCSISNFANTSYILTDIYAINHTGNFNTNMILYLSSECSKILILGICRLDEVWPPFYPF